MMSQCSPRDAVVICSENLSNNYRVTTAEILSHAKKLGVDFLTERHLLSIVLKGLLHPLPENWIPCYDKESGEFFYYNLEDNVSQWEHPIDEHYRLLISNLKKEYNGSVNEFSNKEENLNMLPLRQNRKPQLLPIKQLLKFKDEERTEVEDKIFKPDLHSSLKTKNDASPAYKKTVSFVTSEPVPNKGIQFRSSSEFENPLEKVQLNKEIWSPETGDPWKKNDDFRNVHEHGQYSSDDDNKLDGMSFSKNLNQKITTLKQSFNQKSNSETQPSNNFKRLHINLRHPDSLFSDSNHDDTIKNILSASPSSELVSEEEESPHNVLTNVTESGIDVNTVTDMQKLKARNKLTNQNSDVNKQISRLIEMSLRSAMVQLEQNLDTKIEAKTTEEIKKLKKLYRTTVESNIDNSSLNIKKGNEYEIANEAQEIKFRAFKEEIEKEIKENRGILDEFQNKYHVEMNKFKENLNECAKLAQVRHDCFTDSENLQKQLESLVKEKLNNIEQNLVKKVENLETSIRTKLEEFKTEKEKNLMEYREKFQSFIDENQKNAEKLWQENFERVMQRSLNEFFAKEMKCDDPVFQNMEKIVVSVLNEKQIKGKIDNFDRKTTATQTENTFNEDEIVTLKRNINQISTTVKHLVEETSLPKRFENKEIFRKDSNKIFLNRSVEKVDDPIRAPTSLKVDSFKTDFSPFEEFSSHIDEELDRYRRKYLSSSNWLNIETNKDA